MLGFVVWSHSCMWKYFVIVELQWLSKPFISVGVAIHIAIWPTSYRNQQFCLSLLSILLFVCSSCCPSFVILSIGPSFYLSVHIFIHSWINNSYLHLFVSWSICLFVHLFVYPQVCVSSDCNTNSLVSYFLGFFEAGKKIPPHLRSSTKGNNFGVDILLAPLFLLTENVFVHK